MDLAAVKGFDPSAPAVVHMVMCAKLAAVWVGGLMCVSESAGFVGGLGERCGAGVGICEVVHG